nr:MAG TPA: hypothetical protein [Caudoviricetes sp.]
MPFIDILYPIRTRVLTLNIDYRIYFLFVVFCRSADICVL